MNVSLNHPVLVQLRDKAIPFNVCGPHIEIDGFGKAGTVRLEAPDQGVHLVLFSRYDRVTQIYTFDDLLREAWHWLWVSMSHNNGCYTIHENWRKAFVSQGWLPLDTKPWSTVHRDNWKAGEDARCST